MYIAVEFSFTRGQKITQLQNIEEKALRKHTNLSCSMDLISSYNTTPPPTGISQSCCSDTHYTLRYDPIGSLLFGIADFESDNSVVSSLSESDDKPQKPPLKRARFNVNERKETVERYLCFIKNEDSTLVDGQSGQSVRTFVDWNNKEQLYSKLHHSAVSKWLLAYKRGDYEDWDGVKQTQKQIASKKQAVRCIDSFLKRRDRYHGVFNKVVVSPSLPGEYGVVARRFTPAGTFLGYYKGEVLRGQQDDTRNHDFTFSIGRNRYIDASHFHSCFARYYNSASEYSEQNVCAELLKDWKNPQKGICFIANRDIEQGEEFLVSYGPDYWLALGQNIPATSNMQQICKQLSNREKYAREVVDSLYSVDAPRLAEEFLDDVSDTDKDGTDSDYTP
jgi:hypothetical protein